MEDDLSDSDDSSECSSVPSFDDKDSLSDGEISEDELLLTSGDNSDCEDHFLYENSVLQIAQPPEVLEPSIPIEKYPGVPYLMRHKGYTLCGDNWDKNVHTRHMRLERRNQSLHYFHLYAVENRVDFVCLSDQTPDNSAITDFRSVAKSLLPSLSDDVETSPLSFPGSCVLISTSSRCALTSRWSSTFATNFMKK
jgi:hypothetical protein